MEKKKTLVIGASPNNERYSWMAVNRLRQYGHLVVAYGNKSGTIADVSIETDLPHPDDIDTVTMYMNAQRQAELHDYILSLNPKRIIFNPGAENPALEQLAEERGIETVEGCTLVMLSIGNY
jgi:uncharacterized protein